MVVSNNYYPETVVTNSIFPGDINKKNFPGQKFNIELSLVILNILPTDIQLLI